MKHVFLMMLALFFCQEISAWPPVRPTTPRPAVLSPRALKNRAEITRLPELPRGILKAASSSPSPTSRSASSSQGGVSLPSVGSSKSVRQKVRFNDDVELRTSRINKRGEEVYRTRSVTRRNHPYRRSDIYDGADPAPAPEPLVLPLWKR